MNYEPRIGDIFLYLGDKDKGYSPIESVLFYINGDIGVLKVISMCAGYEDFTARYEDVVEEFPDFSDPGHEVWRRYLFLDMDTRFISGYISGLYYGYYDEDMLDEKSPTAAPTPSPDPEIGKDDLPF